MPNEIPKEGQQAPLFSLLSTEGKSIRLADYKGSHVVVYFYPKDATPGCTTEAHEFRDAMPEFRRLGVDVLGISPDSVEAHCKFTAKEKLSFPLLADNDHKVAEEYGLWIEKHMYGRKFWGVQRATFLIGPDGNIVKSWPKVIPKGHAKQVLESVAELKR